jgi:hypothetical protein
MKMKPATLSLTPSPSPLESPLFSEKDILQHRRLHCGHYNGCLNQSVREGWGGFSCMHCPLRDAPVEGLDRELFAHDRRDVR